MQSQRSMKRTKAGVLVRDITLADIEACFTLPTEKACVKLGVGLTILKRLCRKHGIQRWPYRSLLKAGKAQRHAPAASPRGVGHPKPRGTPSPATRTKPFQQTSTASSHTSHGCQLSGDDFGSVDLAAAAAGAADPQQWAPFAAAPMPVAAVAAQPPSPPPLPILPMAADEAVPGGCPAAFLAAMQPVAAPSPRKRKQPAGGFEEVQPQPEGPAGLAKPDSQMNLLLCAIDACERSTPAATAPPDTPLELREPFFSPVSPLACLPPASVFERRPFSHSQRSGSRPPAPPAPVPLHTLALPATAQQQPAATSSLQQLKSLLALKMALLPPRPALPKTADQDLAAFQLRARSSSGPIPISALPPTDLLEGMSAQDSLALHSARSLLAQY
ncbi:hypothetical protein COHA_008167 [Chlorella ohadii]|uniref:RWP-RK domain-containing protein n=1 Tax=Chlorella ohadii TaxID=2649997 RepID=A0AAD5DH81_9CHLO|nr:hypothetical protein COHA_008167 [Chlorella ohadii]